MRCPHEAPPTFGPRSRKRCKDPRCVEWRRRVNDIRNADCWWEPHTMPVLGLYRQLLVDLSEYKILDAEKPEAIR